MTRILYLANIRLPTEKAHGLQIMQNCEAFTQAGAEVRLWIARRWNTPAMNAIPDVWAHYGVARSFALRRIPCIDLLPLVPNRSDWLSHLCFYMQQFSYTLVLLFYALFTVADVYYSRDPFTLLALSFLKPRRRLAYEAHQRANGIAGQVLQHWVVRRVGTVIAITEPLARELQALSSNPRFLVAHDGIQAERFRHLPTQAAARESLSWPRDAFIVGYMGRLHTMTQDKGVGLLIEALRQVEGASLALVGGPDEIAASLRAHWISLGLPEERFLYAGQVTPPDIPRHLSAFDVCVMPHPFTPHFAYYSSPLKLFEYMASGRAVIASDLPSWADVLQEGENALLVPAGQVDALAAAIGRLQADPRLRERLAAAAADRVWSDYTWSARARRILEVLSAS
jgi:glycosyltransferase involved in cell wall biosynthesis